MLGKSIVLLGAESTGKTTLAHALAARFSLPLCPEYVRTYLSNKKALGLISSEGELSKDEVPSIAIGQIALEDTVLNNTSDAAILDTSLLMTYVYARYYFKENYFWLRNALVKRLSLYQYHFLLVPDIPFIADPQRGTERNRLEVHQMLIHFLHEMDISYITLKGEHENRLQEASQTILSFL